MRKRTRKHRPQLKNFICLKSLLPSYSQAEFDPHFKVRVRERGFDLSLIPQMWNGDRWKPSDEGRWAIEHPIEHEEFVWSVVFDFVDDLPYFITVCTRLGGVA